MPILLVTWIRPDAIERLRNLVEGCDHPVYIFQDGPPLKSSSRYKLWVETSRSIEYFARSRQNIIFKTISRQLGCRKGVTTAIDWFFSKEEFGIVLEDDVVVSDEFIGFASKCLSFYRNEPKVAAITACNFLASTHRLNESHLFSQYFFGWCWATWRDRWISNHPDSSALTYTIKRSRRLGLVSQVYWYFTFLHYFDSAQNHVWDYLWLSHLMSKQLLTVVPSRNLCVNVGFDETATNTFIQAFAQCPIEPICCETTKQAISLDYEFDKMCSRQAFNITTFLTIRTSLTLVKRFTSRLYVNILRLFKAK